MTGSRLRVPIGWLVLLGALLALRLPSLVQPAGGDQGLYVYEAQRVLAGDVLYRDAWDQKPPGIAFLYAALWRIWPHESVVPIADLVAAACVAALLIAIARRRASRPWIGFAAAAVYLLFSDPSLQRNAGLYVRGQCEPFIALAIAGTLALLAPDPRRTWRLVLAGVLFALACWIKYNAAAYGLTIALAVWAWTPAEDRRWPVLIRSAISLAGGFAIVSAAFLLYFAAHGVLRDLRIATITYNLKYSDETYSGLTSVVTYPLTMLVERGHVDFLWFLGDIGALLLVWRWRSEQSALVWLAWLAGALLSIGINGHRDLPNYFVQAAPALAMACAAGFATLVASPRWLRAVVGVVLLAGLWRVGADDPIAGLRWAGLPDLVTHLRRDVDYASGRIDRTTYLAGFKGPKIDALAADDLSRLIRDTTASTDTVYVFGFSGGSVCFKSERESASRFFWSRPVLIEFEAGEPGYGSAGLLKDLERRKPVLVALQREQWESERFFLQNPGLRAWLEQGYSFESESPMFSVWRRKH